MAGRPIDAGLIAAQNFVPVRARAQRLALGGVKPGVRILGPVQNFHHVVAGAEAQQLQRAFHGECAGAPETGADYLYCHVVVLVRGLWPVQFRERLGESLPASLEAIQRPGDRGDGLGLVMGVPDHQVS